MKEIIRLTEADLHQIIKESVQEYMIQEGLWTKLRNGIAGAALATLPWNNVQGQTPENHDRIEQQSALEMEDIEFIFQDIEQNTNENIEEIKDIENHMKEDSEIADIVYSIAFMDETDNFITVDDQSIQAMTPETYNILVKKSETDTLVKITYFDGETAIPNVIVSLDELETALENY